MHRRALTALALAAALLGIAAGDARAATIATPGGTTAVREYGGTIVFSQFDAATSQWRLAIRRAGQAPELLPVAPSDREFEADIGRGSGGPQLVYQRCGGESCDLFTYRLGWGPQGEQAIRNANDPEHHDVHATIWRGRIAWARIYGEQIDRQVIVYTKSLTAPRSRPSTRLPGVPQRRCGDVDENVCGRTVGRAVDALELWGGNLAQIVGYDCGGCSGTGQTEVRLVRLDDRSARQIAWSVLGLSGQMFVGPSFANGRLGWLKACVVENAGCQSDGGAWRYGLSVRRWAKTAPGPFRVHGYADAGASLYETLDCNEETGGDFNANCRIEQVDPPEFEAAQPRLRE